MAAGRAIVTSAIGGTNELIEDGVHGLLVSPGDIGALAEALRRLIADARLRTALGTAARERAAREFSPGRMTAGVTRVYREVLKDGGSAA
jgi:glycosyltransferase involved in cell wall biosynthesis